MWEETGLMLWNPNRDISLSDLPKRKCSCGAPAVAAVRRLDDPGELRIYLCAGHAKVSLGPACSLTRASPRSR